MTKNADLGGPGDGGGLGFGHIDPLKITQMKYNFFSYICFSYFLFFHVFSPLIEGFCYYRLQIRNRRKKPALVASSECLREGV